MKFYLLGNVDVYGMVDLVRLFYGSCKQMHTTDYSAIETVSEESAQRPENEFFWVLDARTDFTIFQLPLLLEEVLLNSHFSAAQLNEANILVRRCASLSFLRTQVNEEQLERFFQPKRDNKRLFYQALSEKTGVSFPWGSLTGIRPTLIAHELMDIFGHSAQVYQLLTDYYFLRPEKAKLVVQTALEETRILATLPDESVGVYLSIPFCPSKCTYCSFSTPEGIGRKQEEIGVYLDCLKQEIASFAPYITKPVSVLYVGGGTPGTLSSEQVLDLGNCLQQHLPLLPDCEMTFEAGRPDQIELVFLEAIQKAGFQKICINPQTFHDVTLQRVGRQHRVEETLTAYHLARQVGFEAINMDLILGLPGESVEQMQESLSRISALAPDSFTIHSLAVKKASKLREADYAVNQQADFRKENLALEEIHIQAAKMAREIGLVPYYMYRQKDAIGALENLGFARPVSGNKYNLAMMGDGLSIFGFGAGAMSKYILGSQIFRAANVKSIHEYQLRWAEMVQRKVALLQSFSQDCEPADLVEPTAVSPLSVHCEASVS